MNAIFIYGAGGAGRELAFHLSAGAFWSVAGFIDDTPEKNCKIINRIPVLGGIKYLQGLDHGRGPPASRSEFSASRRKRAAASPHTCSR